MSCRSLQNSGTGTQVWKGNDLVKHLSCICESLGLIPGTANKKGGWGIKTLRQVVTEAAALASLYLHNPTPWPKEMPTEQCPPGMVAEYTGNRLNSLPAFHF